MFNVAILTIACACVHLNYVLEIKGEQKKLRRKVMNYLSLDIVK